MVLGKYLPATHSSSFSPGWVFNSFVPYLNSYNIEAMASFLPVDKFFSHVYLVDLSPSLCEVARQRFARLGWENVSVVCQDAREFRLPRSTPDGAGFSLDTKADLVTMSYSLSMIPGTDDIHAIRI